MTLLDTPYPAPTARKSARGALRREDQLVLPLSKAVIIQHGQGDDGQPELHFYYGDKEIIFEEPDLFGFAETLPRRPRFAAGDATAFGGEHGWPRIRDTLQELLDEGVLHRAEQLDQSTPLELRPDERASPLPRAHATTPRTWSRCEAVMTELTGRPLELGYLELVVPIFRVAHPALDADHRQIGEANVFPKAMRLDAATEWRTSIYPGSRYQADRPMNVTALKTMRAHWGQMMAVLAQARAAYLARFPAARNGWTVGHLERLATCVLALPTHLLMRAEQPIENGALHPALSSVFRVTDGLRMALHQMLFIPIGEAAWSADDPVTADQIHDYAERNFSFHSETGVCAGPRILVREFLSVVVDGATPHGGFPDALDPEVVAALADLESAMTYGLLGLQAYAAVFSLWPTMTRAYEALHGAAADWADHGSPAAMALRDRLAGHVEQIRRGSYLGDEALRRQRDVVFGDMYGQCALGVSGREPAAPLDQRLAPKPLDPAAGETLRRAIVRHTPGADLRVREALAAATADYLAKTRAVLGVACEAQRDINRCLGRAQPERAFDAWDIDLHNQLLGADLRRLPYLLDELQTLFGLEIRLDSRRIQITEIAS